MPYIELPAPIRGDRSCALLALTGIMMFPGEGEQEGREYLLEAALAEAYEQYVADGPIKLSVPTSAFQAGEYNTALADCQKLLREAEARNGWPKSELLIRNNGECTFVETGLPHESMAWLRHHLRFGGCKEFISGCRNRIEADAWMAAQTLLYALHLSEVMPKKASLGNARKVVKALMVKERRRGGGDTDIYEAWKKFSPVSHMWAAFCYTVDNGETFPCHRDGVEDFLWLSEYFRKKGENFAHYQAKASFLDASATWKLRPEIRLNVDHTFSFGELPEYVLQAIGA